MDLRERIAEPDAAGPRRARRARRHPVGGRPAPVPAEECDAGRPVGARQVRRARLRRRPPRARPPTAAMAVVGSRPCADPEAPTVLLYAHYDVQPPLDDDAWRTPPFELTEVDGRWYGRGAADCKGNIVMHLTALRALGDDVPVNLKLVVEGSEEQGTGGLEDFVADQRRPAARRRDPGLRHRQRRGRPPGRDRQPARHGQRRRDGRGAARPRCTPACSAAPHPTRSPRWSRCWPRLRDERGQHHDRRAGQHADLDGRAVPARAVPQRRRRARRRVAARRRHGVGHAVGPAGGHRPRHRLPAGGRLGRGHRAAGGGPAQPAHPARAWHPTRPHEALVDAPAARRLRGESTSRSSWRPTGSPVPGRDRRPGVPRRWPSAMQEAYGTPMTHARAGRLDPAVQRLRRHLPRRRDHPDGRRGAAGAHPRPERERAIPSEIERMALAEALFLQRYATVDR